MQRPSTARGRGLIPGYHPRRPWESSLYRIVEDNLETFLRENVGPPPAPFAEASLRFFLECGVPRFGLVRFACPGCNGSLFVPFSCKKRLSCPSCDVKRCVLSSSRMTGELLPRVAYRQWVLVIPKRLRYFVNRNHSLAGEISRLLAASLGSFYGSQAASDGSMSALPESAQPAQVHVIQRFGAKVNLHVHIHAVVSDGVFALDSKGKLVFAPAAPVSPEQLERLSQELRRKILRRFSRLGHIPEAVAAEMLAWPHSGFSLNAEVRIEPQDHEGLERLLSYCLRPAISVKRLRYLPEKDIVRYYIPKENLNMEWPSVEFLKRFSAIIPPPRINLVRYAGALGPRSPLRPLVSQAARRKVSVAELTRGWSAPSSIEGLLSKAKDFAHKVASSAWARCLGRILEACPIICGRCNILMPPVAAITESRELTRLLKHLGLPHEFPITKPPRSPPQRTLGEDSQINPLAEAFCGIDEPAQ